MVEARLRLLNKTMQHRFRRNTLLLQILHKRCKTFLRLHGGTMQMRLGQTEGRRAASANNICISLAMAPSPPARLHEHTLMPSKGQAKLAKPENNQLVGDS